MINRDSVVIGTAPRISPATFEAVLKAAGSPATGDAGDCYQAVVDQGVDPCFALSIFKKESQYGTDPASIVVKFGNKNPGNTRSSTIGTMPLITTDRGVFVEFPDWQTGFLDLAHRLVDKNYVYAQEGRVTIAQIIERWAPKGDFNNDPEKYIDAVVAAMNSWTGNSEVTPKMTLKIALAAGHHNTDGGSPVEAAITGPLCHFYAMAFRDAGCDVRVLTPNDGLGQYPGGLQDVAQKVVDFSNAGWTADLFLECHTQGLGDTTVRGCFAIYPDWGSDLDATVKNGLGLAMVKAISVATGIPVWWSGLMSEKATGVGLGGDRLGIFLRTAPIAAKTTRLIIEHGAHSNPQDLALLQNPAIQQRIANAGARAAIDYLSGAGGGGVVTNPTYDPIAVYVAANGGEALFGKRTSPGLYGTNGSIEADYQWAHLFVGPDGKVIAEMRDPNIVVKNGFQLGHGMLEYWNKFDMPGVPHPLGLPLSNEEDWTNPDGKKFVVQVFERAVLGYDGSIADPAYRVQGLLIGVDWIASHKS